MPGGFLPHTLVARADPNTRGTTCFGYVPLGDAQHTQSGVVSGPASPRRLGPRHAGYCHGHTHEKGSAMDWDAPTVSADVTVLGCGLMGSALVRTLAEADYRVVAWNRTYARAADLTGERVHPVRGVADAIRASPLIIACVSTYEDLEALLEDVSLSERSLVNLTSGTPDAAEALARKALARGADYLDGAILAFPEFIGSSEALIAYSGRQQAWDAHRALLLQLGGQSQWTGEQVGVANTLDGAVIASFYAAAIGAYVEAATFALDQGVPSTLVRHATRLVLRTLGTSTKEALHAIESRDYSTEQARLGTYAVDAAEVLRFMRDRDIPARFLTATVDSLDAACAAGLGDEGIYAQAEIVRAPADREIDRARSTSG